MRPSKNEQKVGTYCISLTAVKNLRIQIAKTKVELDCSTLVIRNRLFRNTLIDHRCHKFGFYSNHYIINTNEKYAFFAYISDNCYHKYIKLRTYKSLGLGLGFDVKIC